MTKIVGPPVVGSASRYVSKKIDVPVEAITTGHFSDREERTLTDSSFGNVLNGY